MQDNNRMRSKGYLFPGRQGGDKWPEKIKVSRLDHYAIILTKQIKMSNKVSVIIVLPAKEGYVNNAWFGGAPGSSGRGDNHHDNSCGRLANAASGGRRAENISRDRICLIAVFEQRHWNKAGAILLCLKTTRSWKTFYRWALKDFPQPEDRQW